MPVFSGKQHDFETLMNKTDELRTSPVARLVTPEQLARQYPVSEDISANILATRQRISQILQHPTPRLLVVIGPCSLHDPQSALDYAQRLNVLRERYQGPLEIVMRTYFEKPRTVTGWKGLINDPWLDGSYHINEGLAIARKLLLDINALGMPTATEFLDRVTGQFIADLISWGAIGARTTESQVHREMASALSCPVGFKNGTDGNIRIAIDAIRAARASHRFLSPDKQGQMTIYQTRGNPDGHIILRGGRTPNYSAEHVAESRNLLEASRLPARLVIDFSHGNCLKQHQRQLQVAQDVARQLRNGETAIAGVMIESFLEEGRQDMTPGQPLVYGQSITDPCLSWGDTEKVLAHLAEAVSAR